MIQRLAAGRGGEPPGGIGRHTVTRPPLERDDDGLAEGVLGEADVAVATDESSDDPAVLGADDVSDGVRTESGSVIG